MEEQVNIISHSIEWIWLAEQILGTTLLILPQSLMNQYFNRHPMGVFGYTVLDNGEITGMIRPLVSQLPGLPAVVPVPNHVLGITSEGQIQCLLDLTQCMFHIVC